MLADRQAILIAGPTASGKSQLALELAERLDGVVVNADSMQVYAGLRIVTARPGPDNLARAPHCLYGHVEPGTPYSAAAFVRDCRSIILHALQSGRVPIFCGGTGLYFKALFGLLDSMPSVPDDIRQTWRRRLQEEGAAALHALLMARDPVAAARIAPADGQRIVRALEVMEIAGVPLSELQSGEGEVLLDADRCLKIVITPPRDILRERIAQRFDIMLQSGALEEVAAFRDRYGEVPGTAAKAIGVAELGAVLDGQMSLDAARERTVTRTRQYAKRQETWFRHQFGTGWLRLPSADRTNLEGLLPFR
ncbi:tRNA (adenosine(37)-N6)-dimethylallyltransferase MiaA [Aurantimonas sp. VKM B-3413]|uniref:tRNA (adenosine(37)-N6)-dimethylallyltransferase MiaA n=1 Tax=Aurantimonas sp. VKM B-3413 TaxID=2779401 RepID=UPI001E5CC4BC|nr:tRNA (adenosine(37)-N6)-dimethylallyltransferase MiaA [Aurantimonas sp. VKM B-3413]MCB8835874.1 tRNA (adenosine(37)-N6)-dimethylallyltransferase MiaA [Aurantimonas sp. VKM B-3413]